MDAVEPGGLEPPIRHCQCRVIPLYYGPWQRDAAQRVLYSKTSTTMQQWWQAIDLARASAAAGGG